MIAGDENRRPVNAEAVGVRAEGHALSSIPAACASSAGFWLPAALATFVTVLSLTGGVPELRHDWRIPAQPDALAPLIASFFEPWVPNGIGNAQPYPTFYLVGFVLWPVRYLGAFGVTAAILFATIALAARSAIRLVERLGGNGWTAASAAVYAALNPWVYSKYVAGHVLMVFAYAVLLALLAETARAHPRRWALIVLSALSVTQIEFFIIAVIPLIAWLVARRAYKALLALGVTALPILYGIVATYSQIRGTPFNLSWQKTQSLDPVQALFLSGYVFDYAHAFSHVWLATFAFVVVAMTGMLAVLRDGRYGIVVAIAAAAYVLATGTKGAIAPLYSWAVVHVPEIGLFRELYDLVALVAIGYIVLVARGAGRDRGAGIVLCVAAAAYLVPWLTVPPATFFVGAPLVPQAQTAAHAGERVALLPAFQPLSLNGRGSGVDPDAYVRTLHATPLNELFPTYPVDAALGFATFDDDDRYLAALGVTSLVVRPYLQSNFEALKYQWIETKYARARRRETRAVAGLPLLSLTEAPRVATVGNRPDESSLFFGDVERSRIRTFEPDRASDDPRAGWVDARLAIPLHADWGTSFGGVLTQSARMLSLPMPAAATSLLAHADGTLVDERGNVVVTRKPGLHWWRLPVSASAIRCRGTCIVVLQGAVPAGLPEHRPLRRARPLQVEFSAPWFARSVIPTGVTGSLRLNVRYDRAWAAYAGRRELPHVRLDTALNAWSVSTSDHTDVVFVQRTAAMQFVLELTALVAILVLLCLEAVKRDRSVAAS